MSSPVSVLAGLAKDYQLNLIADDTFKNGPCGWVPLTAPSWASQGVVMHTQEYGYGDSSGSLVLETGDSQLGGGGNIYGSAIAAKRLWRPSTQQLAASPIVELEWIWCFGSQYDSLSPTSVLFQLDTCSPTDNPRALFQMRWRNTNAGTGAPDGHYQFIDNTGAWQNFPTQSWQTGSPAQPGTPTDSTYPHGWNENKRDWHRFRARFDLLNLCYDGAVIDGDPYGSYTGVSGDATAFRAVGPATSTLHTFENGFNGGFGINNSSITILSHCWAHLGRFRMKAGWTP